MSNIYEPTIGFEIHTELKTKRKMFSVGPVTYGESPNSKVSLIDMAYPGILPVVNMEAISFAIRICHALNLQIDPIVRFDRKNYFYSDLPKGYQITQNDFPIGKEGYLDVMTSKGVQRVYIERAHMEEDTAKQLHLPHNTYIDYNRAGIPLIEIVTKPCIHDVETAVKYAMAIRQNVLFLGVSDAKMEEGSLRVDVNISLKKPEDKEFGTKVEIKNINSFSHIEEALNFEIKRQSELLDRGEKVIQETRRYEEKTKSTVPMRLKTDAVDYKYFREPNIPTFVLEDYFIQDVIKNCPELPRDKFKRYKEEMKLNDYDSNLILSSVELSEYFDKCAKLTKNFKLLSNFILTDILGYMNRNLVTFNDLNLDPSELIKIVDKVGENLLSTNQGRLILNFILDNKATFENAMSALNISFISNDESEIENIVLNVLKENAQSVTDFLNGKDRALGFLIGQVMKLSKGKYNPSIVSKLMMKNIKKEE